MIDVANGSSVSANEAKEILDVIENFPEYIWCVKDVDAEMFQVAINSKPMSIFDGNDDLHKDFDRNKYPSLFVKVLEFASGQLLSRRNNMRSLILKAVSKDWRILKLLHAPDEQMQLAALNNSLRALDIIPVLTPSLQYRALDDFDGMNEVLFRCGELSRSVSIKAKKITLEICESNRYWEDTHPYAERYLSLATNKEIDNFFSDEALSEIVNINEFWNEPSSYVKKHFIKRDGLEYFLREKPESWSIGDDLRLWIAQFIDRENIDGCPDVFYLPHPTQLEKNIFLFKLLKVASNKVNEQTLIKAIKRHPDDLTELCWLCWAIDANASAALLEVLVARLSGLSGKDVANLQKKNLSVAFKRLSTHWDDRGIEVAVEVIGRLFPEVVGLYAVASMFDDDLGKRCQYLQNSLMKGSAESVRETRVECDDLFEIDF